MRIMQAEQIAHTVAQLYIKANRQLADGVEDALKCAIIAEKSEQAKQRLKQCLENAKNSEQYPLPLCQDTGLAVIYIQLGRDVHVEGNIQLAADAGVRRAVKQGNLRASLRDPVSGKNTQDNTPALVRITFIDGDQLHITVVPKGGGSENKGQLKMLTPADGLRGAADFVVEAMRQAGGSPCPPTIIGVGIGGAMEDAAMMAKHALLRPLGQPSQIPALAQWEQDVLARLNALGIGAQGLGGSITTLAVHALSMPTHIASLPVAVAIGCHCHRHQSSTL